MKRSGSSWETIAEFTPVGVLGKAHGAAGEIKIRIDEPYVEHVLSTQFLFVRRAGNRVPYKVEGWRTTRDLIVKLHHVDDAGVAAALAGGEVSLAGRVVGIPREDADGMIYAHIVGYTIHDITTGDLGEIVEVRTFPQQEMAVVEYGGADVLIPLNETFVLKIDQDQRRVEVDLPEGLLGQ